MTRAPLQRSFFDRATLEVAEGILGALLVRELPSGRRISGWVTEAEAYVGSEDRACHARHGKTDRNAPMWGPPGRAYVYFTYGMHWMLNAVTEGEGYPAAVLLRGLLPKEGIDEMRQRRQGRADSELTDGPAKLCQALAIDKEFNEVDLCDRGGHLWFEPGIPVPSNVVTRGPRVGLNNVPDPWLSKPWRYQVEETTIADLLRTEGEP